MKKVLFTCSLFFILHTVYSQKFELRPCDSSGFYKHFPPFNRSLFNDWGFGEASYDKRSGQLNLKFESEEQQALFSEFDSIRDGLGTPFYKNYKDYTAEYDRHPSSVIEIYKLKNDEYRIIYFASYRIVFYDITASMPGLGKIEAVDNADDQHTYLLIRGSKKSLFIIEKETGISKTLNLPAEIEHHVYGQFGHYLVFTKGFSNVGIYDIRNEKLKIQTLLDKTEAKNYEKEQISPYYVSNVLQTTDGFYYYFLPKSGKDQLSVFFIDTLLSLQRFDIHGFADLSFGTDFSHSLNIQRIGKDSILLYGKTNNTKSQTERNELLLISLFHHNDKLTNVSLIPIKSICGRDEEKFFWFMSTTRSKTGYMFRITPGYEIAKEEWLKSSIYYLFTSRELQNPTLIHMEAMKKYLHGQGKNVTLESEVLFQNIGHHDTLCYAAADEDNVYLITVINGIPVAFNTQSLASLFLEHDDLCKSKDLHMSNHEGYIKTPKKTFRLYLLR